MTAARVPDPTARSGAEAASARARPRRRSWGALTLGPFLPGGGSVSAQSLPTFAIPTTSSSDRPNSEQAFASVEIHERPAPARGNWRNAGKANGSWSDYANNRLVDNVAVEGQAWPEGARKVIDRAGPKR